MPKSNGRHPSPGPYQVGTRQQLGNRLPFYPIVDSNGRQMARVIESGPEAPHDARLLAEAWELARLARLITTVRSREEVQATLDGFRAVIARIEGVPHA